MALSSCLYAGRVRHRRFGPVGHAFEYALYMLYLDLDEIDTVFKGRWFWSVNRPNLVWFRRRDFLYGTDEPLREAVSRCVMEAGGPRPQGPIRMLTHLRVWGYNFNPVTFYYCFDADGTTLSSLIAEITNTPWQERRRYVLLPDQDEGGGPMHRYRFPKDFHVSPFMPMDLDYDWRFSDPGPSLAVHMRLDQAEKKLFDASLRLEAKPLDAFHLASVLVRYPFMTLRVIAGIYFEALRLKWKGLRVYDHPHEGSNQGHT